MKQEMLPLKNMCNHEKQKALHFHNTKLIHRGSKVGRMNNITRMLKLLQVRMKQLRIIIGNLNYNQHLPVFFCGREGNCIVYKDLIIKREWEHEKKRGNAHSEKSIECLKHKFNLLVPWGDLESRCVVAFHASPEFKAYYRNYTLEKKLMQVEGKVSRAKLKVK